MINLVATERTSVRDEKADAKEDIDPHFQPEEKVTFSCYICHLTEDCHHFGKNPSFVKKQVTFKESVFVMRDPFNPRDKGRANFMVIGGVCNLCQRTVCVECSTFYLHRFCDNCSSLHLQEFPQEIGLKIQKKLNNKASCST